MKDYLMDVHGFYEKDITMLMDDGKCIQPTRDNILNAFRILAEDSEDGDAAFVHYSGHGGNLKDNTADETDGNDETLIPVDFQTTSQIRDDDVNATLVSPMKSGVLLTCVIDACHSGTVLDLPYQFKADGKGDNMVRKQSNRHVKQLPHHTSVKTLPCTESEILTLNTKERKNSEDDRSPVDVVWKDEDKKANKDALVSSKKEDEGSWSTVLKYCSLDFDKILCGAIPFCQ